MKLLLLGLSFIIGSVEAKTQPIYLTDEWALLIQDDPFTDRRYCTLAGIHKETNKALLYFNPGSGNAYITKHIPVESIRYRVDNQKSGSVNGGGIYEDYGDYPFKGENYKELLTAFSSGSSILLKLHSSNKYFDDINMTMDISRFAEYYDRTLECGKGSYLTSSQLEDILKKY